MQFKYFLPILPILLFSVGSHGQNTPSLSEVAPSGNVSNMALPPEIAVFPGVNTEITFIPVIPISDASTINTSNPIVPVKQLVFMDGFQHPFQSVTRNVSTVFGVPKHLVQIFDNRTQRDAYSFLPFSSNDGVLVTDAFQQQRSYYDNLYPNEGYTSFSKSVNNSNSEQRSGISFAPGKSQVGQSTIQGRGTKSKVITNTANEVRIWDVDVNGLPASTSYYAANELTGSETTLPTSPGTIAINPPQVKTYTDRDGKLILKMVADGTSGSVNTWQYTYYVYDTKGNLIYTIPPNAVQYFQESSPTTTQWGIAVPKLCFQNVYDNKNRIVGTRKPGEQGSTWTVFDRKDRVVMRQTPKEAEDKEWEVIFYDKRNRVKATSIYKNPALLWDHDMWQQQIDAAGGNTNTGDLLYYLSTDAGEAAYPHNGNPFSLTPVVGGNTIMSYNWYDNYQPTGIDLESYWTDCQNKLQFTEAYNPIGAEDPVRSKRVEGMATCTMVRVLRSESALAANLGDWRVGISFYDDKGRTINSVNFTEDETAGLAPFNFDYSGTKYDFAGRALLRKHVTWRHNMANGQNGYGHSELTKYEYDATSGNLVKSYHNVDGGAWSTLNKIDYDELGRVKRSDLGGGGEIQDLSYDIRGQLTGINGVYAETGGKGGYSRTFGESLKYDYGFTQPRYDGKIAGMVWRGTSATDMYAYGYSYGQAQTLSGAEFRHKSNIVDWEKATMDYTVSNLSYDKNGNITSMKQRGVNPSLTTGPVDMDDLVYSYEPQSNRLMQVVDNGTPYYQAGDFHNGTNSGADYAYDANGNLTLDLNRNIQEFKYTRFNKPAKIKQTDGSTIEYSYDAGGNKLEEIIIDNSTATLKRTDYVGNCVYQNNSPSNGPNDNLQYMLTPVGRTVFDASSASPIREEYFVKDHLGNVRSTINTYTYSTRNYLASYELASANIEDLIFAGIDEVRDTRPGGGGDNSFAANLNGGDPKRRVGSSLLVHVMAGDKVAMSVNTLYNSGYNADEDQPILAEQALDAIVGTLTGGVGAIPGEWHNTKLVNDVFNNNNFSVFNDILNSTTDPSKPKAYLNYVLFDESMKIVNSMSGAFQANGDNTWSEIGTTTAMEVPKNGYLAVYLSNNSQSVNCFVCADVYFDQLRFTVTKGALLEEAHYYPFGLPIKGLSSHTADEFKENRKKYQGNELIKDLDLQLMDFQARQYDPQIGRFLSVDPLAAIGGQELFSPYAAMGNMPESMTDPNGMQFRNTAGSAVNLMPNSNYSNGTEGASSASGGGGNPLTGDISQGMTFDFEGLSTRYAAAVYWNNVNNSVKSMVGDKAVLDKNGNIASQTTSTTGTSLDYSMIEYDNYQPIYSFASNVWDGFLGGMQNTWEGLKSQVTVKGYLTNMANIGTMGMYGMYGKINGTIDLVSNIPNYTAADYEYGAGFATEKIVEVIVFKKLGEAASFKLNNGWGIFGEKGLQIGNYKIEALYNDKSGGGTIFSLKQEVNRGNNLRWDYGADHKPPYEMGTHSHFRFNIRGNTYGSSAQYPWYAPFQFWKYKKP